MNLYSGRSDLFHAWRLSASRMSRAADGASLIERIAARDATALRALLARHQVGVFRYILRLVGNAAVAEELTNDVFLEVWRNAGNFEGTRSAATSWILSIARHRAISSLRKRCEESWDQHAADALHDMGDDPEVAAQKADKGAIMRRCLNALSPQHKEIIDLVYYHDMSISEARDVLQIPENTVKTRMFHARKRLSELLKEAGIDRGWP
jgi:RNA polymerase sigma-70 factor (ECF subfamily)